MKHNKINLVFDRILYGLFLVLPFVLVIIYAIKASGASFDTLNGVDNLSQLMNQSYSGYMEGTFIYGVIDSAIGVNGAAPLVNVNNSWLIDWLSFAVTISALHLLLDVCLFLPSLMRSLMHTVGWTDNNM